MFSVNDSFCLSLKTTIQQVENYQRSDSSFDRHIRTRASIVELFLRIAFRGAIETLHAFALLPFTAVQLAFSKAYLSRLEMTHHFKLSKQCALALTIDLPATLIDPSQAYTRLINRQFIHIESPQLSKIERVSKQVFISLVSVAKEVISLLLVGTIIAVSFRILFGITRIPKLVEAFIEAFFREAISYIT